MNGQVVLAMACLVNVHNAEVNAFQLVHWQVKEIQMGFWSGVGTVIKFVFNALEDSNRMAMEKKAKAEEKRANVDLTKQQFQHRDNRELVETLKNDGFFGSSDTERRAAYEVLKERGVIPEKSKNNTEQK